MVLKFRMTYLFETSRGPSGHSQKVMTVEVVGDHRLSSQIELHKFEEGRNLHAPSKDDSTGLCLLTEL